VFHCADAVVHHAAETRGAVVVRDMMDGHRPKVWCSDRYAAQQGHADTHQTCLAHLARDVAYALETSEDMIPGRLQLWLRKAFDLADGIADRSAPTIAAKRRALERSLDDILTTATGCDLALAIQHKVKRARDQLLTFTHWPGLVEPTNNACERDLRPAVVQRKVTNGYRSMWAAKGEADIRTGVDTARLTPGATAFGAILQTVGA
jgi:transposase